MKKNQILVVLLTALLTSCASTNQFVKFPNDKIVEPSARIYVIRTSSYGSAIKMSIYQEDKLIGKLGPKSYLCWDVKPGEIKLKSNSENSDYFTINAQSGKTYYILQKVKTGVMTARTALEIMTADEGEKAVQKCNKPTVNYTE